MGERAEVMEGKVKECNRELLELKNTMKKQTGAAYKQSQKKVMLIIKKKKLYEAQCNTLSNMKFNMETVKITNEGINDAIGAVFILLHGIGELLKTGCGSAKSSDATDQS
eukprot:TRINITY_DN11478_c0_g1_i5.p2 TRINITY_DN11478_c0_g1~~TRINITY_DN11478_c0_g1_i5.p2  ORF type:complete len:110 (-),score=30.26 TRINITY_DN11478_c0_g1_i5:269-598(-)